MFGQLLGARGGDDAQLGRVSGAAVRRWRSRSSVEASVQCRSSERLPRASGRFMPGKFSVQRAAVPLRQPLALVRQPVKAGLSAISRPSSSVLVYRGRRNGGLSRSATSGAEQAHRAGRVFRGVRIVHGARRAAS